MTTKVSFESFEDIQKNILILNFDEDGKLYKKSRIGIVIKGQKFDNYNYNRLAIRFIFM